MILVFFFGLCRAEQICCTCITRVLLFLESDLVLVKRDVALDVIGGIFGSGIVPGYIVDFFTRKGRIVVAGSALPWADGRCLGVVEDLLFDGVGREVMVAFNDYCVVGFCNNGVADEYLHDG